jgi:hypothetical protein
MIPHVPQQIFCPRCPGKELHVFLRVLPGKILLMFKHSHLVNLSDRIVEKERDQEKREGRRGKGKGRRVKSTFEMTSCHAGKKKFLPNFFPGRRISTLDINFRNLLTSLSLKILEIN